MYLQRKADYDLPPDLCAKLLDATDGFTGAEIEGVVNDLALTRFRDHQTAMYPDETVLAFFANMMPFSRSNPEDLAAIRHWGLSRAVPAGSAAAQPVSGEPAGRRIVVL
jgi:hypothetical protein